MNYNSQLQANNAQLASLVQTLQDKAAGGSGGVGVETCTVTITTLDPVILDENMKICFLDATGNAQCASWNPSQNPTFTVLKNSILTIFNWNSYSEYQEATFVGSANYVYCFYITGDSIFTYVM